MSEPLTQPSVTIPDLLVHQPIPDEGILTRTVFEAPHTKCVLFTFSAGQELSEHTASMPAVMHFLQGQAEVRLGGDTVQAGPGTWVHMSAGCLHAIRTKTPTVMLLTLFRPAAK